MLPYHLPGLARQLTLCREDDSKWPQKNKDGRQELEIRFGNEHISFEVCPSWPATPRPILAASTIHWPLSAGSCSPDCPLDRENRLVSRRDGIR